MFKKNINQDHPLEIFFSCVQSHRERNTNNSTCASFLNSFKTLIINSIALPHSPGADKALNVCKKN